MLNKILLCEASSTSSDNPKGQTAKVKLAKLATYEINIRSFHPAKTFGWSGINFEGDSRGFSLKPSGLSRVPGTQITSRVWHVFSIKMAAGEVVNVRTESNDSGKDGAMVNYDDVELKPRGEVLCSMKRGEDRTLVTAQIKGSYAGENHAVYLSPEVKKLVGFTFVPSLDVSYEVIMTVDRIAKYMDVVTYVKGDGFPNCEAFISDATGKAVFLGVHVRKGAAPVSLLGDKRLPMIFSAIRLSLDDEGNFKGDLANERRRRELKKRDLEFRPIKEWNDFFLELDPHAGRAMWIWQEPLPESTNRAGHK